MKNEKINVCGTEIDNVTLEESAEIITGYVSADGFHTVVTPNAEILQVCRKDKETAEIIRGADLAVPDGQGVVLASRILGTPLKCKTPGCELGELLISEASVKRLRIFFLGGKPGVGALAEQKLRQKYPDFRCAGIADGYFDKTEAGNEKICAEITASGANILFVCLGFPLQEKWMYENKSRLPHIRVGIGLGGSLDCYAGTVKRAPHFMVKIGLEWLFRLIQQPSRIGRMMTIPALILSALRIRLCGQKKYTNKPSD